MDPGKYSAALDAVKPDLSKYADNGPELRSMWICGPANTSHKNLCVLFYKQNLGLRAAVIFKTVHLRERAFDKCSRGCIGFFIANNNSYLAFNNIKKGIGIF